MGQDEPRRPCFPMLRPFGGVETTCYWPDQIDVAESLVPFIPIRPCEIVQSCTHLTLTQVLLQTGPGPYTGKSIDCISYIFGRIPGDTGGILDPAPPEPKFVVVVERLVESSLWPGPELTQGVYHVGRPGSPEQRTVYGDWMFHATRPDDHMLVVVHANVPKDVIESIGNAIVGAT